jgi:hypothetical protein
VETLYRRHLFFGVGNKFLSSIFHSFDQHFTRLIVKAY